MQKRTKTSAFSAWSELFQGLGLLLTRFKGKFLVVGNKTGIIQKNPDQYLPVFLTLSLLCSSWGPRCAEGGQQDRGSDPLEAAGEGGLGPELQHRAGAGQCPSPGGGYSSSSMAVLDRIPAVRDRRDQRCVNIVSSSSPGNWRSTCTGGTGGLWAAWSSCAWRTSWTTGDMECVWSWSLRESSSSRSASSSLYLHY